MNYSLGNMLSRGGALNPDGLSLDLAFAADKTLTARKGPTPTFSRSSGATQVNASGIIEYAPENILLQSEDFGNATWSKLQINVSTNTAIAPNGSTTADSLIENTASAIRYIFQQTTKPGGGGNYLFSIYFKNAVGTRTLALALTNGSTSGRAAIFTTSGTVTATNVIIGSGAGFTMTSSTVTSVGNGWYRASIIVETDSSTRLDAVAYLNNSTTAVNSYTGDGVSGIFVWGAQLERHTFARAYIPTTTAAVHGARFDHNPVTLASRGLLIEEARTNVALRSEEFNESAWVKNGLIAAPPTVTANQVNSPSGVLSADRIAFPAVSGAGAYSLAAQSIALTSGSVYTASIYLRGLNGGEKVWWSWTPNGVTYARKECVLTTSWQRFDVAFTASAVANFIQIGVDLRDASQSAQSAQTIFAWGAQLELGSFPTSYIPTTTASVVRSADVCSITGSNFSGFYNQSEGTMFIEASILNLGGNNRGVWGINNNTNIHGFLTYYDVSTPGISSQSRNAGNTTLSGNFANSAGVVFKRALAYYSGGCSLSTNGNAVTATTVTNSSQTMLTLQIGNMLAGSFQGTCHIPSLRYFKKRLANAKLQSLTA